MMTATTTGTVSGVPVTVDMTSAAQAGTSLRVGSLRITSSAGSALDALLASQASSVQEDLGFSVPAAPAAVSGSNSAGVSTAELVYDSSRGLRLLNITLATSTRLGLSDLAHRVGFSWQGTEGVDIVSFTGPRVYYVPNKPGAPSITWKGQQLKAAEFGISALVDIPPLGLSAVRSTLLVQSGSRLNIQVSRCDRM
jgi:hypothetical protein